MKTLISIALAVLICAAGLLFAIFKKGRQSIRGESLAAQVDGFIKKWTVDQIALHDRLVNIVLDDTSQGGDSFTLPEAPSAADSLLASVKSLFGRGGKPEPTYFAKSLAQEPNTTVWSFEGFSASDEPRVIQAVMDAVVKAREAGAQVNLITVGNAAGPGYKAVENLSRAKTKAGELMSVRKLVMTAMNRQRLQKMDPVFSSDYSRPGNVTEMVILAGNAKAVPPVLSAEYQSPELSGNTTLDIKTVKTGETSFGAMANVAGGCIKKCRDAFDKVCNEGCTNISGAIKMGDVTANVNLGVPWPQEAGAAAPAPAPVGPSARPEAGVAGASAEERQAQAREESKAAAPGAASRLDGKRNMFKAEKAETPAGGETFGPAPSGQDGKEAGGGGSLDLLRSANEAPKPESGAAAATASGQAQGKKKVKSAMDSMQDGAAHGKLSGFGLSQEAQRTKAATEQMKRSGRGSGKQSGLSIGQ